MEDPKHIMATKRNRLPVRNTGHSPNEASVQNSAGFTSKLRRFGSLELKTLLWDLPKNLGDFIGKPISEIVRADSVSFDPNDGFNAYMWQNGDGFKLYLELIRKLSSQLQVSRSGTITLTEAEQSTSQV